MATVGHVLITGASSGIGLATALAFARRGWKVSAAMRRPVAEAEELNAAIGSERLSIRPLTIDVHDDASVQDGVQEVLRETGHIDVLVNNAGIGGRNTVEEASVEWAKAIFETNYFGAVRMLRAVLPGMRERRAGTIVNISSVMGRVAPGGHAHYSASKHALEAASEALVQEVRPFGIRVILIEPGVVLTAIFARSKRALDEASPYFLASSRLDRFFRKGIEKPTMPEAVAETIIGAVDDPRSGFRHAVGDDAIGLIAGRRRITDEEWAEEGRPMPDAEYLALIRKRYGLDLS